MPKANCQFRGSGGQYFVTVIFHLIILGTLTFGIYSAWAWVRLLKLKASHTTMNGKPVSFTGTGGQLFVLCLIQGILSVITLGLYSPWAVCAIFRWMAQNTLVEGKPSTFTGTGGSLFLLYLIHFIILPLLTLGLYYFWGMRRFYGWKEEHTRYGGERASFGAGVGGFISVTLITTILNTITLYLFSPWAFIMYFKWQVQGLAVGDDNQVQHFPPARTGFVTVACLILIAVGTVAGAGYLNMNQLQNIAKNLPQKAANRTNAGQKRTYKMPAPKPPATPPQTRPTKPPQKRPTKPDQKVAPSRVPTPRVPEVKPEVPKKTVNYKVEMDRVNKLLKLDKKNQNAIYNRAWLHAYKGNFPLAEKDYSLAIAVDNKLEDAYFNRGLALIKLRKFGEAVNDFTRVIKMNPVSTDAFCNRGNAYFELGKKGLALTDYNAALEINPKDADIYYNRAFLHRSRGQKDAAMADFKKAAALGQNKARKHLNLPPARPKTNPKTSIAKRKLKPANVNMSSGNASGTIHGANFRVEKATLANGILTLRQGKDFFPDQAVMIFLFLKDGEAIEGKTYDVSRDQGFGSPHIHMKWKEEGENLPKTQIYMKNYIMRLEFGKKRNGTLAGKITLALPDEHNSEVNGKFRAELK